MVSSFKDHQDHYWPDTLNEPSKTENLYTGREQAKGGYQNSEDAAGRT